MFNTINKIFFLLPTSSFLVPGDAVIENKHITFDCSKAYQTREIWSNKNKHYI
jgi:hypothetical protein